MIIRLQFERKTVFSLNRKFKEYKNMPRFQQNSKITKGEFSMAIRMERDSHNNNYYYCKQTLNKYHT